MISFGYIRSLEPHHICGAVHRSIKATAATGRFLTKFAVVCLCGAGLSGCGQPDRSPQFIPSPSVAESAVKSGMESWKKGEPAGPVPGTSGPAIHVIDSHRKSDQHLDRYEILGEVPGNAPRCFAVKAHLTNPDKEERLRYIVVGIDPLWVFRQEDYDLLSHWSHPMEKKSEPADGAAQVNP